MQKSIVVLEKSYNTVPQLILQVPIVPASQQEAQTLTPSASCKANAMKKKTDTHVASKPLRRMVHKNINIRITIYYFSERLN